MSLVKKRLLVLTPRFPYPVIGGIAFASIKSVKRSQSGSR